MGREDRPTTCAECRTAPYRHDRCRQHDEEYRRERFGHCPCGRVVWSRGLCSSCVSKDARTQKLARSFQGNPENKDNFVGLVYAIIDQVRARRAVYVRFVTHGVGGFAADVLIVEVLLRILQVVLSERQYSYVLCRINDGSEAADRLPYRLLVSQHGGIRESSQA